MDLKGKVVAITGAGQGIGRAIALALAERGADVALLDVDEAKLAETRQACERFDCHAQDIVVNVAAEEAVDAAMAAVVRTFGRFDGLVNNAGITRDALLVKVKDGQVVGRMTAAQWQAVLDVNLSGPFFCGRAAAEEMIRLGNGGAIVNMASAAREGNAGQTNYSAAKAAVVAMANTWAKELGRYGIRAASVAPGFTATDMLASVPEEVLRKIVEPVPIKRLGLPEEIANAVLFVLENDFITGRCIDVDGGLRL